MFKNLRLLAILVVLLTFAISLNFSISSLAASANKTIPVKSEVKKDLKIIVYYFYAKPRCVSCKKIEAYTKEAVDSMNNKNIEYRPINLDEKENSHYAKDYKLYTKSVVISKVKNGKQVKWKNLDGIWTKLNNEKEFKSYVTKEIKNMGG